MYTPEERFKFWSQVDRNGPVPEVKLSLGPCWVWTGYIRPDGYGEVSANGKRRRTHRMAWEIINGLVPGGLELDHLCRNRGCCRLSHLEAVTPRENKVRGEGFGGKHSRITHCPQGHEYNEDNTIYTSQGYRACQVCWGFRIKANATKTLTSYVGVIY